MMLLRKPDVLWVTYPDLMSRPAAQGRQALCRGLRLHGQSGRLRLVSRRQCSNIATGEPAPRKRGLGHMLERDAPARGSRKNLHAQTPFLSATASRRTMLPASGRIPSRQLKRPARRGKPSLCGVVLFRNDFGMDGLEFAFVPVESRSGIAHPPSRPNGIPAPSPPRKTVLPRPRVPHEQLPAAVQDYDAFIMPFKINALTKGVDPVKLYEYLTTGKPVLSIRYPEVERFSPYVHFFSSSHRMPGPGRTVEGRKAEGSPQGTTSWLSSNRTTWEKRTEAVAEELLQRIGKKSNRSGSCDT